MWLLTAEAGSVLFVINLLSRIIHRIHRNAGFELCGRLVSVIRVSRSFHKTCKSDRSDISANAVDI